MTVYGSPEALKVANMSKAGKKDTENTWWALVLPCLPSKIPHLEDHCPKQN